jgi:hypothetical protein
LHVGPAAEDAEPGRALEREAHHREREALDLLPVVIADRDAEDALVRLDVRRVAAPAGPVADELGAAVGEVGADAMPEHLGHALGLRDGVGPEMSAKPVARQPSL